MNYVVIKNKVEIIVRKNFFRNVVTMASGAAFAQLISMFFSPFITRIYGPEAFGLLGSFVSILTILTTVAALTYPVAIVLPKEDVEAKGIFKLSIFVSLIMSFLITIFIFFLGERITEWLKIELLLPYLYLIPLIMFFSAARQSIEQWLIRKKLFKVTAKVGVIQSLILNISKTGVGFLSPLGSTLIIVTTFGYGLHMLMLALKAKKSYVSIKVISRIQEDELSLKHLAKKYSDFPFYRSPQVLLAAITQSMPVLMLTSIFGPAAAGFYTIGITVLGVPSQLIGKAVGDVFYPRISEASKNKENMTNLLIKSTLLLLIVGFVPFSAIIIFGPELFKFIFGSDWQVAGVYASWIALWSYALFISNPSIKILPVLSAQKFHLVFTVFNIIIRGSALLIGGMIFKSDIVGVALYGASGALLSIVLTILTIMKSREYENTRLHM